MPSIDLLRQAARFLENLPAMQARQIAEKLRSLESDPSVLPSELLRGYAPMRRLKSGEFRIIFSVEGDLVRVLLIGKRNDDQIYKALERGWRK